MYHKLLRAFSFAIVLAMTLPTHGETLEEATSKLIDSISGQLVKAERTKVAALDFTDIQGRANELGRFLADQISVDLVIAEGITVVDRSNLNAIMAEHKLTADGLVKPENAKKLGEFAGVDAILIGNLATMENECILTLKAISTDTSEVVAAGRMRFEMTEGVRNMLGQMVDANTGNGAGAASTNQVQAGEAEAIMTKQVGPLTVSLQNVRQGWTMDESNRHKYPTMNCTFILQNRRLDRPIVVAGNQVIVEDRSRAPESSGYRGSLKAKGHMPWVISISGFSGVAAVSCFEVTETSSGRSSIVQNNPTSIINYIRTADRYKFDSHPDRGRHWSGSFTTIPPGESVRLSVTFTGIGNGVEVRRGNSSDDLKLIKDDFSLDIELVIGTFDDGQPPEKSTDLSLRNISLDRVTLPSDKVDE